MSPHPREGLSERYGGSVLPSPTPRLRFREMTSSDLPLIETLELGGSRGPAGWIDWNRRNYVELGFGLWIVETHAGEFVGDCGLTLQDFEGTRMVEAGWHVAAPLRRQGHAAEAAAAVRAAAHENGVDHLVAIIRPENVASRAVARKIGLAFEREIHKNGAPALLYGGNGPRASDQLRSESL